MGSIVELKTWFRKRSPWNDALKSAQKMVEAQQALKHLLGEKKYEKTIGPFRDEICRICQRESLAPIQLLARVGKDLQDDTMRYYLICAVADLIEEKHLSRIT